MGSGGGLGLAAVLAAAVLCGPGGLAGRVLSGECAGSAPGAGGRAGGAGPAASGVGAGAGVGAQRSGEQEPRRGRAGAEAAR